MFYFFTEVVDKMSYKRGALVAFVSFSVWYSIGVYSCFSVLLFFFNPTTYVGMQSHLQVCLSPTLAQPQDHQKKVHALLILQVMFGLDTIHLSPCKLLSICVQWTMIHMFISFLVPPAPRTLVLLPMTMDAVLHLVLYLIIPSWWDAVFYCR